MKSLQETYAPTSRCFGCGPANEKGLRIGSFESLDGTELVCEWTPEPHHLAFEGVLNGGIIGALLDCHSNWTAAHHLMKKSGEDSPPCTVTADFHVKLTRPTPMDAPLTLPVAASLGNRNTGVVTLNDSSASTNDRAGAVEFLSSTTFRIVANGQIAATVPITWASGDAIRWLIVYEAA